MFASLITKILVIEWNIPHNKNAYQSTNASDLKHEGIYNHMYTRNKTQTMQLCNHKDLYQATNKQITNKLTKMKNEHKGD